MFDKSSSSACGVHLLRVGRISSVPGSSPARGAHLQRVEWHPHVPAFLQGLRFTKTLILHDIIFRIQSWFGGTGQEMTTYIGLGCKLLPLSHSYRCEHTFSDCEHTFSAPGASTLSVSTLSVSAVNEHTFSERSASTLSVIAEHDFVMYASSVIAGHVRFVVCAFPWTGRARAL